jgi:alcohol dehydrogenase
MRTTESLVLKAPGPLELQTFPLPTIGQEDGLLQVELAGICGTDWKTFHGKLPYPTPVILGHEILGRLAQVGPGLREKTGLQEGDRVSVAGSVPCWSCRACHTGSYRFCDSKRSYGTSTPCTEPPYLWGSFGRYMYLAPGSILHRVADDVPAEAAVLVQGVMANGFQWAGHLGQVRPRQAVVIQGCGPQGLGCTVAAREFGAALVIVTGLSRDAQRLDLAHAFGADATIDVEREDLQTRVRDLTGGELADVVIDVSGSPAAIAASVQLLHRQGTLVLAGLTGRETITPMLMDHLVWNEITVRGAYTKGSEAVRDSLALVASRKYPLEQMVSHTFGLDQAETAIRAIGGELPGTYPIKAAVRPGA